MAASPFQNPQHVYMLDGSPPPCDDDDSHLTACFAVSLRQCNYCKQESRGSEEDVQPQTTSVLLWLLSAAAQSRMKTEAAHHMRWVN